MSNAPVENDAPRFEARIRVSETSRMWMDMWGVYDNLTQMWASVRCTSNRDSAEADARARNHEARECALIEQP